MWFPTEQNNGNSNDAEQSGHQQPAQRRIPPTAEINAFKAALDAGEVRFSYYKTLKDAKNKTLKDADGNAVFDLEHPRQARGTRNRNLMPVPDNLQDKTDAQLEKGMAGAEKKIAKKHNMPADSIFYWDFDAQNKNGTVGGFRSFKQDGLIEFTAVS